DEESLGPAMRAPNPMQRRFVMEWAVGPIGYGAKTRALRAAGYKYTEARAGQLWANPKIQAALLEVGGKRLRLDAFTAIRTVRQIANDPNHRDQLKACLALLDRGGWATQSHHTLTVEHAQELLVVATDEVLQRIATLAEKAGLNPVLQIEAAKVDHPE